MIYAEARRQDRSLSWIVQQAWKVRHVLGRFADNLHKTCERERQLQVRIEVLAPAPVK